MVVHVHQGLVPSHFGVTMFLLHLLFRVVANHKTILHLVSQMVMNPNPLSPARVAIHAEVILVTVKEKNISVILDAGSWMVSQSQL
jgi:hypothetical protein